MNLSAGDLALIESALRFHAAALEKPAEASVNLNVAAVREGNAAARAQLRTELAERVARKRDNFRRNRLAGVEPAA